MQATLTDEQIARLKAISTVFGNGEVAAHRAGLISGVLQLAQAQRADAKHEEALTKADEHTKLPAPRKSAVNGFIDALEMAVGL
jgi:hypothetical protein